MIAWLAVLLLVCAVPAWAGSFSVTTTREQDAAITWKVAQRNAEIQAHNATAAQRGVPVIPDVTALDYVQQAVAGAADGWVGAWKQSRETTYRERIDALDATTREKVLQDLGVTE